MSEMCIWNGEKFLIRCLQKRFIGHTSSSRGILNSFRGQILAVARISLIWSLAKTLLVLCNICCWWILGRNIFKELWQGSWTFSNNNCTRQSAIFAGTFLPHWPYHSSNVALSRISDISQGGLFNCHRTCIKTLLKPILFVPKRDHKIVNILWEKWLISTK